MTKIIFTLFAALLLGSASAGSLSKGPVDKKIPAPAKKYINSHYSDARHFEIVNFKNGISEIFFLSGNAEHLLHFNAEGILLQEEKEITHYQLPAYLQPKVSDENSAYISQFINFKGEIYYSIEIEKNGSSKEYVYDQSGRLKAKEECNLLDYQAAENESYLLM